MSGTLEYLKTVRALTEVPYPDSTQAFYIDELRYDPAVMVALRALVGQPVSLSFERLLPLTLAIHEPNRNLRHHCPRCGSPCSYTTRQVVAHFLLVRLADNTFAWRNASP